jgi:endonuclease-3
MEINWVEQIEPLLQTFGKRKHPLDYNNRYQLVVMVILSMQATDILINKVAKELFGNYPSIDELAKASVEDIQHHLKSVRNFGTKSKWLAELANTIGDDSKIPTTMAELVKLPGIGRKSANVIIRESGDNAEGIIVDLHVLRVAPRLGIAEGDKPEKIEKQLMEIIPQNRWNETGMALSYLGREICRPTDPKCTSCMMNKVCRYYFTGKV